MIPKYTFPFLSTDVFLLVLIEMKEEMEKPNPEKKGEVSGRGECSTTQQHRIEGERLKILKGLSVTPGVDLKT
ncbi:hypothetical protein Y1Q_0011090 [Alligator mississippiensis]|uniref:Uncharacterized protein n=1 Tax=Alligator mississippiensis TaxID=8496 RepID=A0A151MS53_ALLMI|nr:hypothetical protein Y1Q_0011090 [Alligator mississippiensis]